MQDFTQHGWLTVPNFLDRSLCDTLYQYCRVQAQRIRLKQQHDPAHYHKAWDGTFTDSQAPGNYALYGDPIQDVVMYQNLDAIRNCVDLELQPAYSYWRLYVQGSDLKNHVDRESCEISVTINLGQSEVAPWPIHLRTQGGIHSVGLEPGDALIFGMYTVHGTLENHSKDNKIRLTCDIRFQPKSEPQDPRYFGVEPGGTTGAGYGELNSARPLNEDWHIR